MTASQVLPDDELLARVVRSAGNRLKNLELVRSGRRVLLAKAFHEPSRQNVLLSVSRPEFSAGREQIDNVTEMLTRARSSDLGNVVDRFWALSSDEERWWCVVTPWHENSVSLESAVANGELKTSLVACLRDVTKQLARIHAVGFAHGDVSLANVLVTAQDTVHLVDFEYVTKDKFLDNEGTFATLNYSHPARLALLGSGQYDLDTAQEWDRYALGQIFLQAIADADPYIHSELNLYTQRALRLIGCLLLAGANSSTEIALGIERRFFIEEKYVNLSQASDALARLLGEQAIDEIVPELSRVPGEVVQVGLNDPAPFSARVRALVSTPEMRQISSCLQLGLICLIWPTATHTRLEHALGTYATMKEAVISLNADPQSPIFRILATPTIMRTLLAAALLHDVGHYPLAHDLEEAYPPPFKHEARSIQFITEGEIAIILSRAESVSPELQVDLDAPQPGWGLNPLDVASVISGTPLDGSSLTPWTCGMLHSILSGALDVDKLDYLVRDSNALGVAAGGGIDVPRVISSLAIAVVPKDAGTQLLLAVRAKGIRPAELVGRVRSHMFGVAYWHRSYRSIKAMMHWIVWEALLATGDLEAQIRKQGSSLAAELYRSFSVSTGQLDAFNWRQTRTYQIPQREAEVLAFVSEFSASATKVESRSELFRLLSQHKWYKAVLTIDHFDNLEISSPGEDVAAAKALWQTLDRLVEGAGKSVEENIHVRMELSRLIQAKILRAVSGARAITRILDPEAKRDRLVSMASTTQLFMLDFIEKRKSHDKPLYFLASERPGSRLTNTATAIPVRRSYDQQQLAAEFLVSNGAIRLFCHPDFSQFIEGTLSSSDMQQIVKESAEELLALQPKPTRRRKTIKAQVPLS